MNKLLIHNDNIAYKKMFEHNIKLPPIENIDDNISKNIIPQIQSSNCDIIFIKDNLSSNYLELYGFRVAYHIRLSEELGDKRYLPIVILSDVDSYILNKIEPLGRILSTKNIFLEQNHPKTVKLYDNYDLKPLHVNEYKAEFLDKIQVEQPKDYLTHHSIANEWAMHRWSEYLEVTTDDVKKVNEKISSMLYFKYLKAKFPIKKSQFKKYQREITEAGKILYIDDEWAKGWGNILKSLHSDLHVVEEKYKDKTREEIIEFVLKRVNEVNPDLVILDMRLHEDDFKEDTHLDEFTGMQIFQKIKEINEGIQFIIFTASSNSLLLDEIQSYDTNILSYIKKEHPDDANITTQENIDKIICKTNEGLKKKYLKEIWTTKKEIKNILQSNPFSQYITNLSQYEINLGKLKRENENIFGILNSVKNNRFNYAMVSIATSLEAIVNILLNKQNSELFFWDGEKTYLNDRSRLEDKVKKIIKKLGYKEEIDLSIFISVRNFYMHSNDKFNDVNKIDINNWFKCLLQIIKIMNNPPNYIKHDIENLEVEKNVTTKGGLKIKKRTRAR